MILRYIIFLLCFSLFSCSDITKSHIENQDKGLWSVDESLIKEGAPFEFVNNPEFKSVTEVEGVEDDDRVILVKIEEQIKVYPYVYLNYSEVINDEVKNTKFIVSYCPQTKSGICFSANFNNQNINMIASGYLFKDNLILSDIKRENFWSQMLIDKIRGELSFSNFNTIFSIETKWKTIKDFFPEAKVYYHDYLNSKGKSKNSSNSVNGANYFGVINKLKEEFVEVFKHSQFSSFKIFELVVNGKRTVVFGDDRKKIFTSFYIPENIEFSIIENEFPVIFVDHEGNKWDVFGEAVEGNKKGERLESPIFYNADLWAWKWFFNKVIEHSL